MNQLIKDILRLLVPGSVQSWRNERYQNQITAQWEREGSPLPPPHVVKQKAIKEFQKKTGYSILVETGTYRGAMVEAQKSRFKKIISIELGKELFEEARKRFNSDANVNILQGDSGKLLPGVVKDINAPAIFWLDGHYSAGVTAKGEKECPIFEELEAILSENKFNHVLLIDDARCYTGLGDYPSIEKLTEFVKGKNSNYRAEVKHDIIRFEAEM